MSTSISPLQRRGINKLPLELLTEIFQLAATYPFLLEQGTVRPAYALFALSHVCGTWRAPIRGVPQLWAVVCGVEPPAMIREIVALAQNMPLVIFCAEGWHDCEGMCREWRGEDQDQDQERSDEGGEDDAGGWLGVEDYSDGENGAQGPYGAESHDDEDRADEVHDAEDHRRDSDGEGEDGGHDGAHAESNDRQDADDRHDERVLGATSRDAAEIILARLHRISWIQIALDSDDIHDLLPLFDANAPLLESLGVRVVGQDADVRFDPFKGEAPPHLTKLSLSGGCELSHTSSLWMNLTDLHLHRGYSHREPYLTNGGFAHFSHALRQMCSLTTLDMCLSLPPDICTPEPWNMPPIPLPRLTALTVRDFAIRAGFFLPLITDSQLDTLCVEAEDNEYVEDDGYEHDYYLVLDACRQLMQAALSRDPLDLVQLRQTRCGFRMEGQRWQRRPADACLSHDDGGGIPLEIEFVWDAPLPIVLEEMVARAVHVVPPRETYMLLVEMENLGGVELPLVAQYLDGLGGIAVETITMSGYEDAWWLAPEDKHFVGSDHREEGDGELELSDTNTEGDGY
ncbi:hypothetical protein EYR36_010707 [Pleurotus pulmonarius]|nr:hypothetical protein EYR36_010707 [Pleurotus pulmonarius]